MRRLTSALLALAALALVFASVSSADKPEIDPTYANRRTVYMIG